MLAVLDPNNKTPLVKLVKPSASPRPLCVFSNQVESMEGVLL